MEIWPVIHDERKALAADLKGRTGEEWATPSLCGQWTVRDVLAHMTSAASLTPPAFFAKMIGSGFSFDKVQASGVAANRGSSPADTMTRFEAVLTSVKHPPGPADTWLGETIVHAEDIRRPLGIEHQYPTEAVVQVASFYQGSNLLIGSKKRIEGLTPARHRRRVVARHRARGLGSDPVAGHGHDRAQGAARRPHRRRRGDAALPLLAEHLCQG